MCRRHLETVLCNDLDGLCAKKGFFCLGKTCASSFMALWFDLLFHGMVWMPISVLDFGERDESFW